MQVAIGPRAPVPGPRSVNTPTKTSGIGAGSAADLTYWESAARMIARNSLPGQRKTN